MTKPKFSYFGFMKLFHKIFWHVKGEDVDRVPLLFIYDPMKGTMKIHSICALNKNNVLQLFVKDLTCFCGFYFDSHCTKCQNVEWTCHWCQNNFSFEVCDMYENQCMMSGMESANLTYKVFVSTFFLF
jgi:hypothetical protein